MNTNFRCQLLYCDTDSFLYEIKSKNLYREISENKKHFNDLWNYPKKQPLYDPKNNMVASKFEDQGT